MSKTKRTFRIVLIVIILLVPLSLVLKSIIKKKIEQEIEHFNDTHPISITYSNLNLSFLAGNSTIESLKIVRDSVDGGQNVPLSQHPHIYVGKIKIRGLSVSSLIFDKKIDLNKIIIQDVEMVYYEKVKKLNQEEEKEASLDSIRFKGLEGFSLGVFEIDRYQIVMLNKASDTLTNLVGQSFEIDGIKLDPIGSSDYFKTNTDDLQLKAIDQSINLNSSDYQASLGELHLRFNSGDLSIRKLKLFPLHGAQAIADSKTYNADVVSLEIEALNVHGLDFDDLLLEQNILIDSIMIDQANVDIFKDKNKPFDMNKRPKLIHQKLKHSNNDIAIGQISLTNSSLHYVEKNPGKDNTVVDLTNLSAQINNLDNTQTEGTVDPMTIALEGIVLNAVPFDITLTFSDVLKSDYFRFKGSTGSSKFESFNTVLLPTTGIKFEKGNLNGITFNGQGNSSRSEGQMTMLFDNLDAAVLKKDQLEENKTFSFLANAAIKDSNPSKNGRVSVAEIEFDRTMYKGFGNYLFKTVESGLVNSVYPFGDRKKIKTKRKKGK